MPPEKKKEGGSKKKKGADPEEQLRRDLLLRALSLRGEREQENSLEGQYHAQSESLASYWEIEKKARDERRHVLLGKEHRMEGIHDRHVIDLAGFMQTIKQLLSANEAELLEKTSELFREHQSLSDTHQREVSQLDNDLRDVSNRMEETTRSYDKLKLSMRGGCNSEVTTLREDASRKIVELAVDYANQYKIAREDSEKKLLDEAREMDRQNEDAIKQVTEKFAQEMQHMITGYSVTMTENLNKIATLRRGVVLLREQDRHDRRVLSELRDRNNGIMVPLESKTEDLKRLQSDVNVFHDQKRELDARKEDLRRGDDELKAIQWDNEVLFQKLLVLEIDRDECKNRAQEAIHLAQRKSNFQNLLLERKLGRLITMGEKDVAAIAAVLRKANVDLDMLDTSRVCIKDVIEERKAREESSRMRLKHIKDSHEAMLDRYRKLMEGAEPKSPIRG